PRLVLAPLREVVAELAADADRERVAARTHRARRRDRAVAGVRAECPPWREPVLGIELDRQDDRHLLRPVVADGQAEPETDADREPFERAQIRIRRRGEMTLEVRGC